MKSFKILMALFIAIISTGNGHAFDREFILLEAKKYVSWFNVFLEKCNGSSFFKKGKIQGTVHLDACLTGMSAVYLSEIYDCKTSISLEDCLILVLETFQYL